jgi:hypothetical protein
MHPVTPRPSAARGRSRAGTFVAITAVAAAASLTLAACGSDDGGSSSGGTIKVGIAVPLTGPAATVGGSVALGAKLAVSQINEAGGINGKKLKVVSADTTADLTQTAQEVRRLLTQEKVDILVGPTTSDQVNAVIKTINSAGVRLAGLRTEEGARQLLDHRQRERPGHRADRLRQLEVVRERRDPLRQPAVWEAGRAVDQVGGRGPGDQGRSDG